VPYPRRLLNEDEEILLDLHPHWKLFIAPGAVLALGVAVAGAAAWFVDLWQPYLGYVGAAIAGLALIWLLVRILVWRTTNFVLTSDRLIFRAGVLSKRGLEIPLERVNNIAFQQSLIERVLRSGDLVIESAGETGQQTFSDVLRPTEVQNAIYRAMEAAAERDASRLTGRGLSVAEQLEKLGELVADGVLTQEEFERQKAKLLAE